LKALTNVSDLSDYFRAVSRRLKHHGAHWRPVVQTLALELQAALASNVPLYARTYNGSLANQIKLTLRNGRSVKVTYHGGKQEISIRDASNQRTICTFSPSDKIERVAKQCRQLARRQRIKPNLKLVA
jgi:hypothetical protein